MVRSALVIALAIVCGLSAAIGIRRMSPQVLKQQADTQTVYIATSWISRGSKITKEDIEPVQWPTDLLPDGIVTNPDDAIDRSVLNSIVAGEPLITEKLSKEKGKGYASNTIPTGMRACTIQTKGPAESVAGFIRPDDIVDVLLNLRGQSTDNTGGGSTLTLLQSAKVFAINDKMDISDSIIEQWMKEGVESVTILVSPEQARLVALGQSVGSLSFSLRNGKDQKNGSNIRPVTVNQIRGLSPLDTFPLEQYITQANDGSEAVALASGSQVDGEAGVVPQNSVDAEQTIATRPEVTVDSSQLAASEPSAPKQSFIYTLRGNQSAVVPVFLSAPSDGP